MVTARTRSHIALVGGSVFGIGLAAVLDVIVFHLIFQTHHLLSNRYSPQTYTGLQQNIYYDGLFSLGMLIVLLVGAGLIWWGTNWCSQRLSTLAVIGSVVLGMGVFNTIDGIVDHYIFHIHEAVHGTMVWNPPWILVSLVLVGVGGGLLQWSRQ